MTNQVTLYDNHELLKTMMKKYLGDIVDSEEFEHLFVDDPNVNYEIYNSYCTSFLNRLSHLHKCIILVPKYPIMNNYLEEYLQNYDVVNGIDDQGSTALHYACNLNFSQTTKRTVEILINSNANVNLRNINENIPLYYTMRLQRINADKINELETDIIRILILAGADIFGSYVVDYFSPVLIKYFKIHRKTKTIGIISGQLTKPAKK